MPTHYKIAALPRGHTQAPSLSPCPHPASFPLPGPPPSSLPSPTQTARSSPTRPMIPTATLPARSSPRHPTIVTCSTPTGPSRTRSPARRRSPVALTLIIPSAPSMRTHRPGNSRAAKIHTPGTPLSNFTSPQPLTRSRGNCLHPPLPAPRSPSEKQ